MFEDRKPRLSPEDRAFLSVLDQVAADAPCIQDCLREIDSGATISHSRRWEDLAAVNELEERARGFGHSVHHLCDATDPSVQLKTVDVGGTTSDFQIHYAVPPDSGLYVLQVPSDSAFCQPTPLA